MTSAVLVIVVVLAIVGSYAGWHANRAYIAHADIKATKSGRLPTFRRVRRRSAFTSLVTVIILVLVLIALVH